MENTKKITKAMVLEVIRANADTMDYEGTDVNAVDVINYVDVTLGQFAAKAEKAKERAAEKKASGDALRAAVKSVLTNELQTRDAIFAQIEDESGELTVAKVGARLTQLVGTGEARKEQIKDGDRKVMGYALAIEDAEDVEGDDSSF